MKIKWTTITEDESTWPPFGKRVVRADADGDEGTVQDWVFNKQEIALHFNQRQWRPMPKPPKKKEQIKPSKESELLSFLYSRLQLVHGENVNYDYMIHLRDLVDKAKTKESPWRPRVQKPSHNREVLVRSKLSTGEWVYGIGCIFRGDWSWDKVAHVGEWMEIPE